MLPNISPTFLQKDWDCPGRGAAGSGTPEKSSGGAAWWVGAGTSPAAYAEGLTCAQGGLTDRTARTRTW